MSTPPTTPRRCPRCGKPHLQIVPYSAAELDQLTEADFRELDTLRGNVCSQWAWWQARRQKDGNGEAA